MTELDDLRDVVLVDALLSARLERTEGLANARFVEARQSAVSRAAWIEVAGAYALFDGPDSPLTQSVATQCPTERIPNRVHTNEMEIGISSSLSLLTIWSCHFAPFLPQPHRFGDGKAVNR